MTLEDSLQVDAVVPVILYSSRMCCAGFAVDSLSKLTVCVRYRQVDGTEPHASMQHANRAIYGS